MLAFRSFLFNVFFYVWLAFILVAMMLALPFPRRLMQNAVRVWARVTQWGLEAIVGLDYRVVGMDRLPPGPVILASKHQSAWDTHVYHLLFADTAYVMKKELLKIPLWGWVARKCQSVVVDRSGGGAALKQMVRDCRKALTDGRPLVIFPEGTRSKPGDHHPYSPGIYAIYVRGGAPVVPVALNSGVFWGRRDFKKHPGTITIEFLDPMPAGLGRKEFLSQLEDRIEGASRRLAEVAQKELERFRK